ncbi:MAG: 2OG-Fe(II) oxygenase [Nostocales cyanobacterium]|nr:MAG: 2OG-Fe(II) oxygenase [Nostocales cyanobacterium]TAF18876.1 MAG: 2OG-Fe(II) oxygenase [Nostocales cyanobacterium]
MIHNRFLQKTRNKILKTIDTIPYLQHHNRLAYQADVEKYNSHLSEISCCDLEIVKKIEQDGIYITSLKDLEIPNSFDFLQTAKSLIPEIPTLPSNNNNQFVVHASSEQIMANPIIYLWGLEPRLINIVEHFLGLPVAYHGVYVRRDVANNLEIGSRLWHIDKEAHKILKVIVYLHDVDENNGAFEYLTPDVTLEVAKSLKYRTGYICDQIMQSVIPDSYYQPCVGKAGTVIFAATHSIFHRGKIPVHADRYSVFFDYTPRLKEHSFYGDSCLASEDITSLSTHLSQYQKDCLFY